MTPEVVAALETAALGGDPEVRAVAAAGARPPRTRSGRGAGRAAPVRPGELPSARPSATGPAREAPSATAARQVHYQGVVLPDLIERGDVEGLAAVAEDRTLPEATRLGAVEGLAAMARGPAEDVLRRIGLDAETTRSCARPPGVRCAVPRRMRRKAGAAKAEVMP